MAVISRGAIVKELVPGLHALFGKTYDQHDPQYKKLFDEFKSQRAFEEEVLTPGFGQAAIKPEGASVQYTDTSEGFVSRYTHDTVALAFAITEEAVEDNLYKDQATKNVECLANSLKDTKETIAANIFNRAFNSTYKGGDGKELLATDHPMVNGSTFSNELTTPADLSETSLESIITQIHQATDDRGLKISIKPTSLHIAPANLFNARRILGSTLQSGTGNNDINVLNADNFLPEGHHVNQYFTDEDAWFIRTNVPHGLKYFNRRAYRTAVEGDFNTGDMKYKADERYSFGWSNPRSLYGSAGSAD